MGETTNGWRYNMAGGRAGDDLAVRAALAKYALGTQLASEVIYPNCTFDADGEPLDGRHAYRLHFAAGQLPPLAVLWNLSMYDEDMLFIDNDLGRYSIGSTTDDLQDNPDGSLTVHIAHTAPEDPTANANWLPAPTGPFKLTFRFYGPAPASGRRSVSRTTAAEPPRRQDDGRGPVRARRVCPAPMRRPVARATRCTADSCRLVAIQDPLTHPSG